jgi:hypothetical protein
MTLEDLPRLSDEDRDDVTAGGIAVQGVPMGEAPADTKQSELETIICEIDDAVMIGIGVARDALEEYLDKQTEPRPLFQLVRDTLFNYTGKARELLAKHRRKSRAANLLPPKPKEGRPIQ